MKRFLYITAILATFGLISCSQDWDMEQPLPTPDGYVDITFKAAPEGFSNVNVRAVDPDGIDIQNMTLFCFSNYGLFITTVNATITPDADSTISGMFKASIPEETHRIHFIANQNPNLYDESNFRGKSEAEVIAAMEGASGMMIYWARFVKDESAGAPELRQQLESLPNGVQLLRNQAKITIANPNSEYLNVTGFVTTNRQAFGTVAPFHSAEGFVWPGSEPFVTMPRNKSLMSDITDIDTKTEDYLFESENDDEHPVSIIIKGSVPGSEQQLYYRVVLIDQNGDRILVRRNYSYNINIVGKLSYGKSTFSEALVAPASNNVWVSVASWVNEIEDDDYILTVDKTYVVLNEADAGKTLDITYSVKSKGSAALSDAEVSWVGDNTVAYHQFADRTFDASGNGKITLQLLPMSDPTRQQGTLLIKKGRLQRTVDIIVIKTQLFTPAWVGTQVYGGTTGEFVTIKFTVPETCPEELYPFNVLISVNSLDVRSASGMNLPVIRKGDEGYGADNEYAYKYVYTVDKPGVQRLYFHTILTHPKDESQTVVLEADYFQTLTKYFTFTDHQRAITLEGLLSYSSDTANNPNAEVPDDEVIYYLLVPQKRNAPVTFDMQMINKADNTPVNVSANDEFLVYSKSLDFYSEGHDDHDALFYSVSDQYWQQSTNGRVFMFMIKEPERVAPNVGQYTIHLKTNTPVSADIVRLASNNNLSQTAIPAPEGTTPANYTGNTYRSVIFELANYHPFHFAAQINGQGEYATTQQESVSNLEWSYQPNQNIDISFEITSFQGSDGKSVDPFGESFDIYIDAPMLDLDESRFAEYNINGSKVRKLSDGRFVYTVEATRVAEQAFGYGTVLNVDASGANQVGDRKTIPFKTNTVTSAGTITLSSDKEKVVFYDKTFKITNSLITGTLKVNDGTTTTIVPQYAFVAFARTSDGVRIGSVNVGENGTFTLNLRSEYSFNWFTDAVEFDYIEPATKKVYECKVPSLNALYTMSEIVLTPAQ